MGGDGGRGMDISWKRMLLRSRALLASRRSIAPSMMRAVRRRVEERRGCWRGCWRSRQTALVG